MQGESEGYVVRYPGGDFEVVGTNDPIPSVGATIRRRGRAWKVIDRLSNGHLVLRVAPETKSDDSPPRR